MNKQNGDIAVTMVTLKSHNHIIGDIERGVKVYNGGGVEWEKHGSGQYFARVPHKGDFKMVTVTFTRDGTDIKSIFCHCTCHDRKPPVCRHVVAAVLAIQGGIAETKLALGKTATVKATVDDSNIAKTVGSGSLEVFATPSMVALMERAACECLSDCLESWQTSVGIAINVSHNAASPVGAVITVTAAIEYVFGHKIEFFVTAIDNLREIGKGKHTRMIVDTERFMKKIV